MQLWYIKIDISVAVIHNMLLVTSVHATCFGCTDYSHAFDIIFETQNKMHVHFKFVRYHKFKM